MVRLIAAVLAVLLIGTGWMLYRRSWGNGRRAATRALDPAPLALRVERNAGQLLLSWNREATPVKTAQKAVLTISDGDHKGDVYLDLGQLRSGSFVYSPITNDVSFRLEVVGAKGKSLNESVRVIAGRASPAAPFVAREESLVVRLSPVPSPPQPPGLEGPPAARPVEKSGPPPPPAKQVPKPPPQEQTPRGPLRAGGNVPQAKIVRELTPIYPPLARQARVSGVVRVEATIGRDGRILRVQALSGPPLLRQAAVDAVRQWVYEPTLLNGQPVEVITEVDVTFNLNR